MVDIIVRELCNIPHNTTEFTSLSQVDTAISSGGASGGGGGGRGRSGGSGGGGRRSASAAELVVAVLHGQVRFA